jgi:hypothetical protein
MKLSSLFVAGILIVALAVMVAPVVKADQLPPGDPIVKAAGAGFDAPAGIITTSFTIASPTGTSPLDPTDPNSSACVLTQGPFSVNSPACQFQNDITENGNGIDIDALIFELPSVPTASVNCDTAIEGDVTLFGSCSVMSDGGDGTIVTFNDGTITYGTIFTLGFEGFTGGLTSSVIANVPEPGILMLLVIGFVALIGFGVKRSAVRA